MERFLLYDSGCNTCSKIASTIDKETNGWLIVRSLYDQEMQDLLNEAAPGWAWEPMLVEIDKDKVKILTGLPMSMRLLRGLGPQRTLNIIQLINLKSHSNDVINPERRSFF